MKYIELNIGQRKAESVVGTQWVLIGYVQKDEGGRKCHSDVLILTFKIKVSHKLDDHKSGFVVPGAKCHLGGNDQFMFYGLHGGVEIRSDSTKVINQNWMEVGYIPFRLTPNLQL